MKDFRVFASCHNHSTFSDGEYTPEVLARIAGNLGHGGIILTDHDTVKGYPFMKEAAEKYGLKTMIGIELSTNHTMKNGKRFGIHLCGFDFDPNHPSLRDFIPYCASIQTDRSEVLFKMAKEEGLIRPGLEWDEVLRDHPNHDYICNNEIFASYMKRGIYRYDEYEDEFFIKGKFAWNKEREEKVVAITGKSYSNVETSDAIRRVREAGGVAVIAHPNGFIPYLEELCEIGAMGFETRHSAVCAEDRAILEKFCSERGLYQMGGADHENVLGGLLSFDNYYSSEYEQSGIDEESFNCIYERRLG